MSSLLQMFMKEFRSGILTAVVMDVNHVSKF